MKPKIKVLYLISSNKHGNGGHYYSLRTTAEALSDVIEPSIVVIGKTTSPVIESSSISHKYVYNNGWNNIISIVNIIKIIQKEKPDVIHGFDWGIPLFGRIASFLFKIPFVNTLPGGGNPTVYYPYVDNLILYSHENYKFFKSNKKFKNTNLYLIPNRVLAVKDDKSRLAELRKEIFRNKKTFLRISRFAEHYKESIMQAINLVTWLNNKNFDTQLVLIGTVEDQDVFNEIKNYLKLNDEKNVFIFTQELFTINASQLIDVADFVIGTGRGFMEASSKNKIMFTPIKGATLPVLIDEENFLRYFDTNFSPRNVLSEEGIKENENKIFDLLSNENKMNETKVFSRKIFSQYFDINMKKEYYRDLYENIEYKNNLNSFELIELYLRQMRSTIRS
jgi:UDP-N-acetylglucosamine:LPS N-acetylglucosamine transferase